MKNNKLFEMLGINKIIESLQNIVEVRVAMVKKEIEEKVTDTIIRVLPLLLVLISLSLLVLFGSLTLSFYLTEVTGSYVYGFGIVTLLYLLMSVVFFLLKDSATLKKVFGDSLNKQMKDK